MMTADNYPPAGAATDEAPGRRLFLIEGIDADDALLRVLGPFAVQQASVQSVVFTVANGRFALRLEAEGLAPGRARHLCARLTTLPLVTSVSIGWRNGSSAVPVRDTRGAAAAIAAGRHGEIDKNAWRTDYAASPTR